MACESISGEKGEGRQFPWQPKPEKEASGMLDAKLSRRLEAITKVSQDGRKVQDLFKIMRSHDSLWLQAYANIYANKGAVTPGVNQNTLDGVRLSPEALGIAYRFVFHQRLIR